MTTTDQWLRKVSLIVYPPRTGEGIELSDLHLRFSVKRADIQTPNTLEVRVWNVSEATANRIRSEYTRVALQAGYEQGNFGLLFDGSVKQIRWGKENATDTYMDILAADGDEAYNFAVVSATLAAGNDTEDQINAVQQALGAFGVTEGYMPEFQPFELPRGKVMFGMARDYLRNIAGTNSCTWSIQEGRLQFVPLTSYLPGVTPVLTAKSGMIGLPEQTQDGIKAKCLLNPMLRVSGRVKIDNKSIQQMQINMAYTAINYFPKIAADGVYRLLVVEHHGDNRGNDWYSDLICLAIDDTVPPSMAIRGIV